VTECQATTSEPSPESVRRSLRALVDESAPRRPLTDSTSTDCDSERLEAAVEDAERAVSRAEAAAAFLLDGRLATLDEAIMTAERRGSERLTQRGRRARAVLRNLDAALVGNAERREGDVAASQHPTAGGATTSAPLAERF